MKNEIRYMVELAKFVQPMLPLTDHVKEFTWDYLVKQCPKFDNGFYLQNGVLQLIAESQPEHSRFNYVYSDNYNICTVELYVIIDDKETLLSIGVDKLTPNKKGSWLEHAPQRLLVSAKRHAIRNGYPLLNGIYEEDEVKSFSKPEKKLIDPWEINPTFILTDGLEYFDKEHKYTYDGKELISVTTLLKGGRSGYSNNAMNTSGRKSEAVHNMLATDYDVDDFRCSDEIKSCVHAIRENYLNKILKCEDNKIYREVVMSNSTYAGTADLIYIDENGVLNVVDYKGFEPKVRTNIALNIKRQLVLYAKLFLEHIECDYVNFTVLHYWLNDNGTVQLEFRNNTQVNSELVIARADEYYQEAIEKYWKNN